MAQQAKPGLDCVFAYGTLQFDAVMEAVTGRRFVGVPASLPGYFRRGLLERTYPGVAPGVAPGTAPGLTPGSDEQTPGLLYREVDAETLACLDVFESDIYDRLVLDVVTDAGDRVQAWVYVVAPPHRHRLSDQPWDPDAFLREHGEAFIESCKRFRREGVV